MVTAGMHKNEVSKGKSWDWPGTVLGKSQVPFCSQKLPSTTPHIGLRALLGTMAI